MDRYTSKIRPSAAALRLLLAVVLAVGLMPLPAFAPQAAADDLASGMVVQEGASKIMSSTTAGGATQTAEVSATQVEQGGSFSITYTYDYSTSSASNANELVVSALGIGLWVNKLVPVSFVDWDNVRVTSRGGRSLRRL